MVGFEVRLPQEGSVTALGEPPSSRRRYYPCKVRRRVSYTAVFAMLGVLLNVIVAWSFSLWPTGLKEISDFGVVGSLAELQYVFGTDLRFVPSSLGGSSFRATGVEGTYFVGRATGTNSGSYGFDEYIAGWPLLALRGSRLEVAGNYQFHGCVPLPGILHPASDRPLLFIPIIPGFVANTILYAAVSFGAYLTFRAIRLLRRMRRGLCPSCAYPVGSSPACTECGQPLREQPATKS